MVLKMSFLIIFPVGNDREGWTGKPGMTRGLQHRARGIPLSAFCRGFLSRMIFTGFFACFSSSISRYNSSSIPTRHSSLPPVWFPRRHLHQHFLLVKFIRHAEDHWDYSWGRPLCPMRPSLPHRARGMPIECVLQGFSVPDDFHGMLRLFFLQHFPLQLLQHSHQTFLTASSMVSPPASPPACSAREIHPARRRPLGLFLGQAIVPDETQMPQDSRMCHSPA